MKSPSCLPHRSPATRTGAAPTVALPAPTRLA
ncbi:MAG: hypothetical protein RJA44_2434, partial [Pseudomonadota bacterium]